MHATIAVSITLVVAVLVKLSPSQNEDQLSKRRVKKFDNWGIIINFQKKKREITLLVWLFKKSEDDYERNSGKRKKSEKREVFSVSWPTLLLLKTC